MKRQWFFLAVFLLLGGSVSVGDEPSGSAREMLVVGCPLPLTASYGQSALHSLTLAMEEINAAGGIRLAGKNLRIRLMVSDTGDLDPKVSRKEMLDRFSTLASDARVHVLLGGPTRSEYGLAVMDVVAEHNLVHLVTAGCYTPTWTEKFAADPQKYRKSFRLSGNLSWFIRETRDLLASIRKQFHFSRMYLLTQDALVCREAAELVRTVAEEDGWKIVGQESAPGETTDFTPYLKRCEKSGAQILFLWNYTPNTSHLFEQWRTMKIPALPVGFVEAAEDPDFWKNTGGKCVYSVVNLSEAGVTLSDVTPLSRRFYEAYKKRWGREPRGTAAAASYEGLYLLKDAAERAGSLNPDQLIPVLEKSDLPVVRGRLRFDKYHQSVPGYDPETSVLGNWAQWQDGRRITIWPPAGKTGSVKTPPWLQWWWPKNR